MLVCPHCSYNTIVSATAIEVLRPGDVVTAHLDTACVGERTRMVAMLYMPDGTRLESPDVQN